MDDVEQFKIVDAIQTLVDLKVPDDIFPDLTLTQMTNPLYPRELEGHYECPVEDLLGVYIYGRLPLEIKLYDVHCKFWAKKLGFSTEVVKRVVFCHEAAHFVTHKGIHEKNSWTRFSQADNALKEKLAQIVTLLVLHKMGDQEGEKLFRALARHQVAPYNDWQEWDFARPGNTFDLACATVKDQLHEIISSSLLEDVCDECRNTVSDADLL